MGRESVLGRASSVYTGSQLIYTQFERKSEIQGREQRKYGWVNHISKLYFIPRIMKSQWKILHGEGTWSNSGFKKATLSAMWRNRWEGARLRESQNKGLLW